MKYANSDQTISNKAVAQDYAKLAATFLPGLAKTAVELAIFASLFAIGGTAIPLLISSILPHQDKDQQ
ncbi:MAG: hypothetical protein AAGJ35_05215 [Myxococcota bacterium]